MTTPQTVVETDWWITPQIREYDPLGPGEKDGAARKTV